MASLFGPGGEINSMGTYSQGPDALENHPGRGATYGPGESLLTRLSTGLPLPQPPSLQQQQQQQQALASQQYKYPTYPPPQQTPYGLPQVAGSAALYAPAPVTAPPVQESKKSEQGGAKPKSWMWLAILAVLLCGAICLVVFLVSRSKSSKKGSSSAKGRKKVSFDEDDDEDEDGETRRPGRGGPPNNRVGRRPPSRPEESSYERPVRRPTPAEIHHHRMMRDTHRDSVVRSVSGRSDRLRPEPGYEDAYPETDWKGDSGGPRLVQQPDGSFKLPPNASIPLPDETGGGEPAVPQPPDEPMPAPVGGSSSTLATPIEPGVAPPTASGQPTPVADAFSTPIGQ